MESEVPICVKLCLHCHCKHLHVSDGIQIPLPLLCYEKLPKIGAWRCDLYPLMTPIEDKLDSSKIPNGCPYELEHCALYEGENK